jgi:hypothetical protein
MLFSNGENNNQDKFRYGSIFTSLLLTVVYHPLCYLLRVWDNQEMLVFVNIWTNWFNFYMIFKKYFNFVWPI